MKALAFAALLALAPHGVAQPAPPITPVSVAEFFDGAFAVQPLDHRIAGAVVAVVYRGDVIYLGGFGWADIEDRVPADPRRSLFRIASISKPFVWTALMQLVERGELGLDDPVAQYLDFAIPDTFPEPIRVRHLLTHTPGFEERGTGTASRSAAELPSLRDYLADNVPARVRPPGEQAAYSNYGAALAGYVIERITGHTWADYIDAEILAPLGMTSTNTQPEMTEALHQRLARSYRFRNGRFEAVDYLYVDDAPAGHISTTAADMAGFMLAHLGDGSGPNGRILRPESVREMREVLFQPHPSVAPMLHGFYRSDRHGLTIYGHGGDVNGFHSNLSLFPDQQLGVFVSFNSDAAAEARAHLIAAFVDRFFPEPYLRAAPAPTTRAIGNYAGEYLPLRRNHSTFERLAILISGLTVDVDGNQLVVTGSGGTSRWVPVAEDTFTGLYEDRPLAFRRADDGTLYLYVDGALGSFERVAGLSRPAVLRVLFAGVALISLGAVLGWGYRAFRPAQPQVALPRLHVAVAWLHAAAMLYLLAQLAMTLMGDVEEFQFGVPPDVHRNLLLMSGNLILGAVVVVLAGLQWPLGQGSVGSRLRYDAVAAAALINAWLAWDFNYATYALQLV